MVVLFLVGCKGSREEYEPTLTSKEIYSGSDGLVMKFFEKAPPKEVSENVPMPVGMELQNKGAFNILNGYLAISLEKDYMVLKHGSLKAIDNRKVKGEFRENKIIFDLDGKDISRPKGGNEILTFNIDVKELKKDPQTEVRTSLVVVTSCYRYGTRAVETVCIDPDVYGFKATGEKACEVVTKTLRSQGAPVAVTRIETEMLPDKDDQDKVIPRFVITVKNVGKGEVIRQDKVEDACSSKPVNYTEWNSIKVKAYLSEEKSEYKLDCDLIKPGKDDDGILDLKRKEDKIRCSYMKEGMDMDKGAFSSPLLIILDYGYTQSISRKVDIKRILRY